MNVSAYRRSPQIPVIPAPEPYAAPKELLNDRGLLFAFIMASCYGPVPSAFLEKLDITRQTMWAWRQPGAGVPYDRIPEIQRLLDDPDEPFRLPDNVKIEQIVRPIRGKVSVASVRNQYLVDLLLMIVSGQHGGLHKGTLDSIITNHLPTISGPHIFWRWAYAGGGVPASHISRFQRAMHDHDVPKALNMEPDVFDRWMAEHLTAPESISSSDDFD